MNLVGSAHTAPPELELLLELELLPELELLLELPPLLEPELEPPLGLELEDAPELVLTPNVVLPLLVCVPDVLDVVPSPAPPAPAVPP